MLCYGYHDHVFFFSLSFLGWTNSLARRASLADRRPTAIVCAQYHPHPPVRWFRAGKPKMKNL